MHLLNIETHETQLMDSWCDVVETVSDSDWMNDWMNYTNELKLLISYII